MARQGSIKDDRLERDDLYTPRQNPFSMRTPNSMSFTTFIGCSMDRHAPLRRDVKWNGLQYVGHCRHCHESIARVAHHKRRKREEAKA
jgi:hypothetical protein